MVMVMRMRRVMVRVRIVIEWYALSCLFIYTVMTF